MPVVVGAKQICIVGVWIGRYRGSACTNISCVESGGDRISRRNRLDDSLDGDIFGVEAKTLRVVYELCQNAYGTDEVKEEFLDQLLSLCGISTGKIASV